MVKRERIYKKRIFNTLASRSRPERVKVDKNSLRKNKRKKRMYVIYIYNPPCIQDIK
mgnify:CR=1 FL=1